MKETYSVKEAMVRLGIRGVKTFLRLEKKYPEAFVVIMERGAKNIRGYQVVRYRKDPIDRFAERRDLLKQVKP